MSDLFESIPGIWIALVKTSKKLINIFWSILDSIEIKMNLRKIFHEHCVIHYYYWFGLLFIFWSAHVLKHYLVRKFHYNSIIFWDPPGTKGHLICAYRRKMNIFITIYCFQLQIITCSNQKKQIRGCSSETNAYWPGLLPLNGILLFFPPISFDIFNLMEWKMFEMKKIWLKQYNYYDNIS